MDKELYEIQEKINEYVNKNDVREMKIEIMKLYDKKSVAIQVR